jgi:hypothetical protein
MVNYDKLLELAENQKGKLRALGIIQELAQAVRDLLRENERLRQSFQRAAEDYEKELETLRAKLDRAMGALDVISCGNPKNAFVLEACEALADIDGE